MVDPLGITIPTDFLFTPSKNSLSIETHLDILRIGNNPSRDLSGSTSRSIMTDEGLALVKVTSSMFRYYHCLCLFHVNQLAVRVTCCIYFTWVSFFTWVHFMLFIFLNLTSR